MKYISLAFIFILLVASAWAQQPPTQEQQQAIRQQLQKEQQQIHDQRVQQRQEEAQRTEAAKQAAVVPTKSWQLTSNPNWTVTTGQNGTVAELKSGNVSLLISSNNALSADDMRIRTNAHMAATQGHQIHVSLGLTDDAFVSAREEKHCAPPVAAGYPPDCKVDSLYTGVLLDLTFDNLKPLPVSWSATRGKAQARYPDADGAGTAGVGMQWDKSLQGYRAVQSDRKALPEKVFIDMLNSSKRLAVKYHSTKESTGTVVFDLKGFDEVWNLLCGGGCDLAG